MHLDHLNTLNSILSLHSTLYTTRNMTQRTKEWTGCMLEDWVQSMLSFYIHNGVKATQLWVNLLPCTSYLSFLKVCST